MLDVVYTTWIRDFERLAYFIVTHQSITEKARLPEHKFHVAVESDSILLDELWEFCTREDIQVHQKETKPSLSSMMNFANKIGDNPYVMFMQDDWYLQRPLDVEKCIDILKRDETYWVLRLRNNNIHVKQTLGKGLYLLDESKHAYYYSDNPHIKKRGYHEHTGEFFDSMVNGKDDARCENKMNNQAKQIADTHAILSTENIYFHHIGFRNTTLTDKVFNR